MKHRNVILFWCGILVWFETLVSFGACVHTQDQLFMSSEVKENANLASEALRERRGVIEEEKHYNQYRANEFKVNQAWIPSLLQSEEESTTKISITSESHDTVPQYQTTMRVTDKPTGRGARASNNNWVKLPVPDRDEYRHDLIQREQRDHRDQMDQRDQKNQRDQRDQRDSRDQSSHLLSPPPPTGDLINSRMPRVNFVTQNKALEASESRDDKDFLQRTTRTDDLRPGFNRLEDESVKFKPVYPRQAIIPQLPPPGEPRKYFYDDRYFSVPEDMYRRDPYYDSVDRRRYVHMTYGPRLDRYDENYDNVLLRKPKPKRMIYYAHLPEIVRTPPSVDLRYRYSVDPFRQYPISRNGRYNNGYRRYTYAPYRSDERVYRDLVEAGTTNKDKKVEDKVTVTPIMPQKEEKIIDLENKINDANRNMLNSHQYHESNDYLSKQAYLPLSFQDIQRSFDNFVQYDEPLLEGPVSDQ